MRTVPGSSLTGPAVWAIGRSRVLQWDWINARPERVRKVQLETLLKHCHTAAATEFGRAHGLDRVRSHEDFRRQVPLRTYADYESYLVRMRRGQRDVLWPGLIPFYGQSSGTSSTAAQHKFLPISMEQIRWQQKSGFDCAARYLTLSGDRNYTQGFTLYLLPPGEIKQDGPVGVASNPGIMQKFLPSVAQVFAIPRPPVRDIADYDRKLQAIAETYFDYDVRSISGTTCWFSILFDRLLATAKARGHKAQTISEIWPNLRVLFGGGVHAEPYRHIIQERVGRPITLIDNYNATEGGIFSVTDRLGDDAMAMVPDRGVFYEFVPRAEHGKPDATRLPLWKVEPGVEYSIVLTTSSGLFSYYIGDFIRFTSIFPHRLEFAGRASGMLSVTQELTTYLEMERAVTVATRQHPCTIVDYSAASEVGVNSTAKGRYVLLVEFDREPEDLASFAAAVDRQLCVENRVYREHRAKDVAILAPAVIPLNKGATRQFMEALGQNSVQHKFPRIVDDRRRDLLRSFARPEVK